MTAAVVALTGFLLTASFAVNWIANGAMAASVGVNRQAFRQRDKALKLRIAEAMNTRVFWWSWWIGMISCIINCFCPLLLALALPTEAALGATMASMIVSLPAIPIRLWVWRIRALA